MFNGYRGTQPLFVALQEMEWATDQLNLLTATLQSVGSSLERDEVDGIRNRLREVQMALLSANHAVMDSTNALLMELKGAGCHG